VAAIDDLIAQVQDDALRDRLQIELDRLTKQKKFGLVFEEHLPELAPIYSAPIRKGSLVTRRDDDLTNTWRVLNVVHGQARCRNRASKEQCDIALDELVVVREFGDPIFPSLVPIDRIQNGPTTEPWHILIEADNYHALQLLEYAYAGQVDCIYIDPPYNTGARDWKYNNDYVDKNDRWRHSKWLAMMRRRLIIAKRLLNPRTGVLIVTIDEHEVHHLGMLLEQLFPEYVRQMVTIVINQKGVAQGRLSRAEEYANFIFAPEAYLSPSSDDLLTPISAIEKESTPRWERLLRGGVGGRREDQYSLFFPVFIDPESRAITGIGEPLPKNESPDIKMHDLSVAWPIRKNGSLGRWRVSPSTLRDLVARGYVRLGGYDKKRNTWTVFYLGEKARRQMEEGVIQVVGRNELSGAVEIEYTKSRQRNIKTVWHRHTHDSGNYGSSLLRSILHGEADFDFPKSLYAVLDTVTAVTRTNTNALVLDFFAGSGTTLHAVNLLNSIDGGSRRCILVANNEVVDKEAKDLQKLGIRAGDDLWEKHGVCRAVTWLRLKYTILGHRDDGTQLEGDYLTGRIATKESARIFRRLGFIDPDTLKTAARKKEIVSQIDKIPMNHVKSDTAYFVSENENHTAAILFDDSQVDYFLEALDGMSHITDFYIVTQSDKRFKELKTQIEDLLGPIEVPVEEKRPMHDGFAANLEYFRLDFLEKDPVALGMQFREILPILWMRAGAVGPRPVLTEGDPVPRMLLPENNHFAILVDETSFAEFKGAVDSREDLTHTFLITDSEEAFQEMAAQLQVPHVIQLYRDYLENFMINKER